MTDVRMFGYDARAGIMIEVTRLLKDYALSSSTQFCPIFTLKRLHETLLRCSTTRGCVFVVVNFMGTTRQNDIGVLLLSQTRL